MSREHEVSTKGSSRNLDVVVQDEVVAMMLSALFGFAQHLYPGGVVYILCILILYILLILMTIRHGIVLVFVGIGPLPTAACHREVVAVLVVHTVVVIISYGLLPEFAARTGVVDSLTGDVQIDHRLVVGIQVEDELLVVLQSVVKLQFKVYLVGSHKEFGLLRRVINPLLIVHHIVQRGVRGPHNQVVDWHLAVNGLGVRDAAMCGFAVSIIGEAMKCCPQSVRGINIGVRLLVQIGYEVLTLVAHNAVDRVVIAAALAHKVRNRLTCRCPLRGIDLMDAIGGLLHPRQHIDIAELNLSGRRVILAIGQGISLQLGIAQRRVYQDIGNDTRQTVAEGQFHTRHRRIQRIVRRHGEVARQQGIVAQRPCSGIAHLISRKIGSCTSSTINGSSIVSCVFNLRRQIDTLEEVGTIAVPDGRICGDVTRRIVAEQEGVFGIFF